MSADFEVVVGRFFDLVRRVFERFNMVEGDGLSRARFAETWLVSNCHQQTLR